jgi:hypothetical protein
MRRAGLRGCMRAPGRRGPPVAILALWLLRTPRVKRNFCATAPPDKNTTNTTKTLSLDGGDHLLENRGGLLLHLGLSCWTSTLSRGGSRRLVDGGSPTTHRELVVDALERWRCGGGVSLKRGWCTTPTGACSCTRRSPSPRSSKRPGDSPLDGKGGRSALENAISRSLFSQNPQINASLSMGVASPPGRPPGGAPSSST